MQTDPIGQAGGLNIYAYVGGDPVNSSDWSGLGDNQPPRGTGDDCDTNPNCIIVHPLPRGNQDPSLSFQQEMALMFYLQELNRETADAMEGREATECEKDEMRRTAGDAVSEQALSQGRIHETQIPGSGGVTIGTDIYIFGVGAPQLALLGHEYLHVTRNLNGSMNGLSYLEGAAVGAMYFFDVYHGNPYEAEAFALEESIARQVGPGSAHPTGQSTSSGC